MKILFLSHYFRPEGNAPAARVYEFAKRWAAAGHEVTVITGAPSVPNGMVYAGYRNCFSHEVMDGVHVRRVWTCLAANRGTVRRILNYVSFMFSAFMAGLAVKKPDVIVATSPQFFCAWAGLMLSICRRLPFVLEIRDIWPESITAVDAIRSRMIIRILECMERTLYRRAAVIVTVGDGYRRRLMKKGVSSEKIRVVTNGVSMDSEAVSSQTVAELKVKWCPAAAFVCVYAGTIGMACGLDVVLHAADMLRDRGREDVVFLLVGDGASREQLEERCRSIKLRNVLFAGLQKREDVSAFIAMADACLVHLKKTELFTTVFPSKMLDAAAMKRPVVLGVEGFSAQWVRDADCGICFEPENAEELVSSILKLAADGDLCRRLGENGAACVKSSFNPDRLASDYLGVLQHAMN
ncbi:MAG: glycosyltransferase family 4 protein [Kiritimatiellia bacterium]